jgi:hypothetical protein
MHASILCILPHSRTLGFSTLSPLVSLLLAGSSPMKANSSLHRTLQHQKFLLMRFGPALRMSSARLQAVAQVRLEDFVARSRFSLSFDPVY